MPAPLARTISRLLSGTSMAVCGRLSSARGPVMPPSASMMGGFAV